MARSQFEEALLTHKSLVLGWMRDFSQQSNVNVHELSGGLHTGGLSDAQAPQFLKLDGSRQLSGNLSVLDGVTIDGVDLSAHAANASAHHAPVTILDSSSIDFTISGQQISGSVIASSDVSAATHEWVLKSTAAGGLKLKQLDITNDLTVGNNVLNVDVTSWNVGINCVPDAQFDLDVAGNLRAQGWIVGKHALQVKDALMICHYDGQEPYATDFTGSPTGHMGQVGTLSGGAVFTYGKFGKALQIGEGTTNLVTNPVMNTLWSAWSTPSTRELSTQNVKYGTYSLHLVGNNIGTGAAIGVGKLTSGVTYTLSGYVTVINGSGNFVLFKSTSPYTTYATVPFTESGYYYVTFTMPETSTCNVKCSSNGEFYFDAVQLEQKSHPTPFCYGDMPGHSWSGTAHASTSTRSVSYATYSASKAINAKEGSFSTWMKLPVATGSGGASTTPFIFRWWDAWNTNSLYLYFNTSYGSFGTVSYSGGVGNQAVTSGNLGWEAETWHYIVLTWKEGEPLKIYVDGVNTGTASGNFTAPTISSDTLVIGGSSTAPINASYDETAFFSKALSADEILAIYESDAPIFAETSTWSWRTPTNLAWADANGLFARDTLAQDVFGVIGVDGYSWGNFALDAGDIVLGRNVTGKSAIKWDISSGKFGFYGNAGANPQVEIDTDGSLLAGGGSVVIDSGGIELGSGASISPINYYAGSTKIAHIRHLGNSTISSALSLNTWVSDHVHGYPSRIELRATSGGTYDSPDGTSYGLTVVKFPSDMGDDYSGVIIEDGSVLTVKEFAIFEGDANFEADAVFYGDTVKYRNSTEYTVYGFVPGIFTATSADGNDTFTAGVNTWIDTSAIFGLPAGVKAVAVNFRARWAAASPSNYMIIKARGGSASAGVIYAETTGVQSSFCICPCDSNGDLDVYVNNANALDVLIRITGYWI